MDDIDVVKVGATALFEALKDKDEGVNDAVHKTLCKVASGSNVNHVLPVFCELYQSKKSSDNHMTCMLRAVEQICMQQGEFLESDVIHDVINLIIKQVISVDDYNPNIQLPSAGILVAIGNHYCSQVMEPLSNILKPGIIPHYIVMHTLGSLAATNINGVVPFIKTIMSKILPTLGMIKVDLLKQAFSYALCNFATALNDYFANHQLENMDIKRNDFEMEISIAFDMLYLHWLHSSEAKVIENVLEAIGPMFGHLPKIKKEELTPKIIPFLCNIYKKSNVDSFFVTQSITLILIESINEEIDINSGLIEMTSQVMFPLVLTLPDYDHPHKIKNHFELLRCFDVLATHFSEAISNYLFLQIKNNNEEDKMKSVVILTHLITSSEMSIKAIVGRFNSVLKTMIITEQGYKMKRILLKAIVALAYRQYLSEVEDCALIQFIITQCSNPNTNTSKTDILFLEDDCENCLYLLSSTVPNMKKILLPVLLKSFLHFDSNQVLAIVAKCMYHLTKIENDDKSDRSLGESSEIIYVRCMSLLANGRHEKLVNNVIHFLVNCCSEINENLKVSWEIDLQKLLTFCNSSNFNDDIWESMIIDLFRSAIYLVNNNQWIESVTHEILKQLSTNTQDINRKGLLYKFLSVLLCHVLDVDSVSVRLDVLFNGLHNTLDESKHIAKALGIVSTKHGLVVIEKLDSFVKQIESRKTNRFLHFNFMKSSKQECDLNNLKFSVTLCYREVAKEALEENILQKLVKVGPEEYNGALNWNICLLKNNRQVDVKICALSTIRAIADALISRTNTNVVIGDKWSLVNITLDQMFESSLKGVDIKLYPHVILTITSLVKLKPYFPPEERNLILRSICEKVYNSITLLKTKFDNAEEESSNDVYAKILNDSLIALNSLIKEFVIQAVCPSTLDDLLSMLDEWVDSENDEIRTSVMRSIQVVLVCFIQNVKLTYENPSKFNQAGLLIGKMIPRCADKSNAVRYIAIDCIKTSIEIIDLYEGHSKEFNSETLQNLASIQMQIATNEVDKFAAIMKDLANIICNKICHQHILHFIECLLSGVRNDGQPALACNVVLNNLIEKKGQDLYQNCNDILDFLFVPLSRVQENTKNDLLKVFITFARYQTKIVVTYLLKQPLPFEKCVIDCWRALASDENTGKVTVEILCDVLQSQPLFEESVKYDNGIVVSVHALAATSALHTVFDQPEVKKYCMDKFNEVFSTVYITFASFVGTEPPAHAAFTGTANEKYGFIPNHNATKLSPEQIALTAFNKFLTNVLCAKVGDACYQYNDDGGDNLFSFLNMVTHLVEVLCKHHSHVIPQIVSSLNTYSRSPIVTQRIAVMAFCGTLIKQRCNDNSVLLETVMSTLNSGRNDTVMEVRAFTLLGLCNIKYLMSEQYEQHLLPVIIILYNALDEYQGSSPKTNIPLVAINGLHDLFSLKNLNVKLLTDLPPILQRIKPFFNTENPLLREASILLYGEIICSKTYKDYVTHALSVFPCFVLHLADDDLNVVKACKQTLKKISPILNAEKSDNMIQTYLNDIAKLHLSDFTVDLMKRCCLELSEHVVQLLETTFTYLGSPWDNIRCNATLAIGILFSNYNVSDDGYEENKKRLMSRLLQLLKDSCPRVRSAAATSLSTLY